MDAVEYPVRIPNTSIPREIGIKILKDLRTTTDPLSTIAERYQVSEMAVRKINSGEFRP